MIEPLKRVRYNRAHLSSVGPAAQKLAAADGHGRYIFATALGYTISLAPAPFQQACIAVYPDGNQVEIKPNLGRR
jgi:hypothetical protein